jgi:hypothetical protein
MWNGRRHGCGQMDMDRDTDTDMAWMMENGDGHGLGHRHAHGSINLYTVGMPDCRYLISLQYIHK